MAKTIMVFVSLSKYSVEEAEKKEDLLMRHAVICTACDWRLYRVTWDLDASIEEVIGISSDCITPYIG